MKHKILGKVGSTGKTTNNSDFDVLPLLPISDMSNRLLRKEMTSTLYEYYLVDDIGEASDYIELCDVLRSASPNDEILIRINSGGGSLATANMVVNAIRESQAHVHGFIESTCASAATLIYLACHSYSLSEDADMMIHTSSSLYGGKEHEQHSYVTFSRKKIHKMVRGRYAGFLTEKEIPAMIYYPVPLRKQKAYDNGHYNDADFPNTNKLVEEVMSLPMHTELDEEQLAYITSAVREFFGK